MATNFNLKQTFVGLIIMLLMQETVYAKNLGVYGETFPIDEQDLKEIIYAKLHLMEQNGELDKLKTRFIKNVKEHTLRPVPVKGLTTTEHPKTFYYDPDYVLKENITDEKGSILTKAGTAINPLATVSFKSAMLFLNADDIRQIHWATKEAQKHELVKHILVQGNVKRAGELLKERIYFDQSGAISRQLGIKHIPCVVTQAGKKLEIREVNINEQSTGAQKQSNKNQSQKK
jgi:conjugal transfer pilus assembly protein TraW